MSAGITVEAFDANPVTLARVILGKRFRTEKGLPGLYERNGDWFRWQGGLWTVCPSKEIEDAVYLDLSTVRLRTVNKAGDEVTKPLTLNKALLDSVMRGLEALSRMQGVKFPQWLDGTSGWNADYSIAFQDVVVDVKASAAKGTPVTRARTDSWLDPCVIPCKFDPDAISDVLVKCLHQWSGGEVDWETTWLRSQAYTCWTAREARLFMNYGQPRAGKGITEKIRMKLVGNYSYMGVRMSTLAKDFGKHKLSVARVLAISEVVEQQKWASEEASGLLKNILGCDPIDLNRKYKDAAENVVSHAAIVMLGNQMPNLSNQGGGLSSKIVPLNFDHSYVGKEDWGLEDALDGQLQGIAGMVYRAGVELVSEKDPTKKFPLVEGAKLAMEKFHSLNNPANGFLEWGYEPCKGNVVHSDIVWGDYKRFCEKIQTRPGQRNLFNAWLESQNSWGVMRYREPNGGKCGFRGLIRKKYQRFVNEGSTGGPELED